MSTINQMATAHSNMTFDVQKVRRDFPVLHQEVHGHPLVYLDNAATTQKPSQVIETISNYYLHDNSNVHRGVHLLSERSTRAYDGAREKVREFLNATSVKEILFTRGVTEGINLVANTFGQQHIGAGDEVLITGMEHHSNIVPWQMLCERTGAQLKVVPINDDGEMIFEEFAKLLGPKTKLVGVVHVSNALGTINPIKRVIDAAHAQDTPVLIDGAQAVAHVPVDVQELDADFYLLSGHKIYGPTGIGVLYGKQKWLESMPPWQGGGDMISSVTFEKTIYNDLPHKFEAGTPNIAGAIGLGAAIDYVNDLGLEAVGRYEDEVLEYGMEALAAVKGLRLIGTAKEKAGVLSFILEGIHPHDVGTILDQEGIAIRTGHHCAQPVMDRFGVPATSRASLAAYNTKEEIDALVEAIHKVIKMFG
ncbi:cysteine desulfurase [bacterium]|nr:cysteine desulfurase [bacterium]